MDEETRTFTVVSESIAGAPSITFTFDGDTCKAELAGVRFYGEVSRDPGCVDARITGVGGEIIADIKINPRFHRTTTQNVVDVISSLLWSHWRWRQTMQQSEFAAAT